MDPAQRLAQYRYRQRLRDAAVDAFDRLCAELGTDKEEGRRRGASLLLEKGLAALVEVRCSQRHKLAGVWPTPSGPLFVASPSVSPRREFREGLSHVRHPDAMRRILTVDLLELLPDDERHPRLRCSCRCGLRDLTPSERDELRRIVALARRTSRQQFVLGPSV